MSSVRIGRAADCSKFVYRQRQNFCLQSCFTLVGLHSEFSVNYKSLYTNCTDLVKIYRYYRRSRLDIAYRMSG